jgi:hypothetical protein
MQDANTSFDGYVGTVSSAAFLRRHFRSMLDANTSNLDLVRTASSTTASVVGAFDKPAAFVQQERHHPSSTTSLSAAAASASSSDAIQTREVVPSAALIFP